MRRLATIEELRLALLAFKRTYNEQWMLGEIRLSKPPRSDATSSGWTGSVEANTVKRTVQEPWGATVACPDRVCVPSHRDLRDSVGAYRRRSSAT